MVQTQAQPPPQNSGVGGTSVAPWVSGEMMDSMHMGLVSTVAPRRRVVVEDMLGRAMAQRSARSWGPQEVLLRGRLALVSGRGVVSAVIVVVEAIEVAGTVHDNLLRPLLSSRRPLAGLPRSRGCPVRLWRW